jgi:ammonium transporter, Amt family
MSLRTFAISFLLAVCALTAVPAIVSAQDPEAAAEATAAEAAEQNTEAAPVKKKKKKKAKAAAAEAAPAELAQAEAGRPEGAAAAAALEEAQSVEAAPAAAPAAAEAAPAEAAPAAAPAPKFNEGNVTWMMTATAFVLLMSVPGLALFYGGMVRTKNMASVLTQVFAIFCVIAVLWVVYGYSVAFSQGSTPFFGGLSKWMLAGVATPDGFTTFTPTATFSKGVVIPELIFAMFQLTFAAITVALIAGAYAERMKFKAVLIFSVLWFTFAYLPMAHMVWWWSGPDAYATAGDVDTQNALAGWLWQMGALDFAGGTVVHINAGVAGLVCALFVGKRNGYGKVAMAPHSLTMSMIGASLLWFGWFGFNAGSNLEANGYAVLAFANTLFATAVAAVAWFFAEWIVKGRPSLLGIISGAIAGLVGITPACGFVGIQGALMIGLVCGIVCFLAVAYLKKIFGYDDALDAFGVHAVGGFLGAILTGVYVNPALGGVGVYENWFTLKVGYSSAQVLIQFKAALTAVVVSGTVAAVIMAILKYTIGVRVTEEQESEGLDVAEHGEKAYNY